MGRVPSLDLLRGLAAFSVAIPHYFALNSADRHPSEVVAVLAVEVFFALSGFVLAPQIVSCVRGGSATNIKIFLTRRWMRTIPPYLVALLAMSYVTGQIMSLDFLRYLYYVQNLLWQHNANDYFPVAWSLSIEEWFYVAFILIVFVTSKVYGRRDERFCAWVAVAFIAAITLLRTMHDQSDVWDAEVRRVTIYRLDSIAYGFLLYLVVQRWQTRSRAIEPSIGGRFGPAVIFCIFGVIGAVVTALALNDGPAVPRILFPFFAPMFGVAAVLLFYTLSSTAWGGWHFALFLYMGRVSYSVYLFHMLLILALRPQLQALSLLLQLAIYLGCMLVACSLFYYYFERPILAARPKYKQTHSFDARANDVALANAVKGGGV
jgi:peptidoglycan/LPS O-acetylase OafA/YrhL